MKVYSFEEFINESLEDGKYFEYPKEKYKPSSNYGPKELHNQAKQEYKEYVSTVQKINGDNLEILVNNLKKVISNTTGNHAFKLNAEQCKFNNFYFDKGTYDFFETVEEAVKRARLALETDNFDPSQILKTRPDEKGEKQSLLRYSSENNPFIMDLYWSIITIAQAYNVEVPKLNRDFNLMTAKSYETLKDEWYRSHVRKSSIPDKTRDKLYADYEKGILKAKKMREAFKKTKLYADIVNVLDIVEKDLKAADNNYVFWYTELEKQAKRDEDARKLKEAMNAVESIVKSAISKEYHSAPFNTINLQKLAAAVYVETGEIPKIVVKNSRIGSWLSGMHHEVTWEVIANNGTSYGTVQTRDNGLDGDDGRPAYGFGPND